MAPRGRSTLNDLPRYERRQYTRKQGARLTYTISADDFGGYRIILGDKLLKHARGGMFRSRSLLTKAFRAAVADIEGLVGFDEAG